MQPERWRQLEEIVQAAIDCEPESRPALLNSACGEDAELRREVESLLAWQGNSGFTKFSGFDEAIRVLEQRNGELSEGCRIGAYRVLREIGRGGMGTVYLASRADDAFQKLVAIKIIRRGLDTDDIIQRFRSERQILATLDHPNIARLLDGGATAEGLPYFVMEYIEGEPIDRYCDQRKLTIPERLRLFQRVCAAVHYAHQNLVIHRDIKPGNVLVTAEGVPRLLDFGIAKLLDPASAEAKRATVTAARLMTPRYASPEQVRGEPVSTASDVYSLGVLLYELLTGHSPYRLEGRPAAEVEAAIVQEEPEKPSDAVRRVEGALTPAAVSAAREGTPEKLRRRLRGDLDNIVLMGMRKEPGRRYGSAGQLSEDIERHLADLAVIARPDTVHYRAARFVKRHRVGVAAAALVFLTLAAGIAATRREARIAAAERDRARLQTAKAERINAFLQDMLGFSNPAWFSPNRTKNPDVKVSEVVEQAAARSQTELADQPDIRADVQRTIGEVYYGQGRWAQAEEMLRAALQTQNELYGPGNREVARTSKELGMVLWVLGRNSESEALLRGALSTYRREAQMHSPDVRALVSTLGYLGALLRQKGDAQAEACFREALQYAPQLSRDDGVMVALLHQELGVVLYYRGDLNEVERLWRTAIDEYRKLPGKYFEMGTCLSNLGGLLLQRGRYEEAEALAREGLQVNRDLLGDGHFNTAAMRSRLSEVLYAKGDYRTAESAARESLEVLRPMLPPEHPQLAIPLVQLGLILNQTGRSREGEKHLRRALDIRTGALPGGHQLIASAEGALGECLTTQTRYGEAEPLLLRSLAAMQANVGEKDPRTIEAAGRLRTLYLAWGKPEQAARYHK